MDNPGNGIAGFRLTEHTWMTELGNWIDAISPDGRRAGALLFDPKLIGLPGVRERVVQAVMTDQRLVLAGLTGLIPVADVVAAGDQVWLLTAQAVSPTLADLLAAGPIDPNGAASLLVETAQTLLALHAAGTTHGSVHPGTVVITAEGVSLLSERGLSDAIRAQVSQRERDAAGWASLARGLAASFGRDVPESAELFERVAATAQTLGLGTARDLLVNERGRLPGGRISRDGLARAARGRSAFAQAPSYARPPVPTPQDEGDIVTLLRVPGPSAGPVRSGIGTQPQEPPAGPVQFGPGVSTQPQQAETPAQRIWREGRGEAATVHRGGGQAARASRARRRRTILSAAVFAVIMAGAILAWFRLGNAPELAVKSINVVAPKKTQGCGSAVMVTATVVTNGAPGEITYEWRKNLDKEIVKGTLRTKADQTSYTVPLRWTLQGRSSVKATATLRVLAPGPVLTDKASFTYKC
ncbi:protein kinase family protein [Nonomuraea gerenzanensis]|uniref:Serine/threonine protein kinase n=1 Tax=Nonomuraea gerenzanensis TaxID=93944 RepID=A0A1M4EMZ3_9ACTN|nr:hypothetical protein [Nonomuraea gerenzanensis]UBU11711.1 hypothetical protein LCN96_46640 [Nonomuraea gerenzanensis]SBP00211.1 serine/threonine protein kinase [Nonomuraea gerenzanensis]